MQLWNHPRGGQTVGNGDADHIRPQLFPKPFHSSVEVEETGGIACRQRAGRQEASGCVARLPIDHALGDEKHRQTDKQLTIGGKIQKEILAGRLNPMHFRNDGQQREWNPRDRD